MRLPKESAVVICTNPKCGREIEEPIHLTNLSVTPTEQYDACPLCFTKLEPETPVSQNEVTEATEVTEEPVQVPSGNGVLEKAEESTSQLLKKIEGLILGSNETEEEGEPPARAEPSGCPENFGYLAKRPKDAPIPQECLLCPKMVDCMLKTKE